MQQPSQSWMNLVSRQWCRWEPNQLPCSGAEVVPNAAAVAVVDVLGESPEVPRGAINVAKVQFQVKALTTKLHEIDIERSAAEAKLLEAKQEHPMK